MEIIFDEKNVLPNMATISGFNKKICTHTPPCLLLLSQLPKTYHLGFISLSPRLSHVQRLWQMWNQWNIEVVVYCNCSNLSNMSHHMLLLLCSGAKMSHHKQVLLLGSGQGCHTAKKWSSQTVLGMKRYIKDFTKSISCIKDSTKIICNFFAFGHGISDRQMLLGSISTGYFIEPLKVFWSFLHIFLFW